jgi:hypothetical protein
MESFKKNIPLNGLSGSIICNSLEKWKQHSKSCQWFQETQLIVETWNVTHFLSQRLDIINIIHSMERFCFISALGLNMGYYHIKLDADAIKLCTIVFPWYIGKDKYKRLPMGIKFVWFLMLFKISCQSLSKIWSMLRPLFLPWRFVDTNK